MSGNAKHATTSAENEAGTVAIRVDELSPGQRKLVFAHGRNVVVFNIDGMLHAIDNACPHNGASLAGGRLEGSLLQCPAHGLRFDLAKAGGPGPLCLRRMPVKTSDDGAMVLVDMANVS